MIGTGYTYQIEDGTCKTPKDFLKLCLKAFGCCIELRDESLVNFDVDEFLKKLKTEAEQPSDYLVTSLSDAEKELEKLLKRTNDDWKKELDSKIEETKKNLEKNKRTYEEESKILSYFIHGVENWNCSEEYKGIKDFALEQLNLTTPDNYEWNEKLLEELSNESVAEYRNRYIQSAIKEVDYYKERIKEEKERKLENVKFIEGFLKEIEDLD